MKNCGKESCEDQVKSFYFDDDEMLLEPMIEINCESVPASSDEIEESNHDRESISVPPVVPTESPQVSMDENTHPVVTRRSARNKVSMNYQGMCNMAELESWQLESYFACLPEECYESSNAVPDPKSYKKAMLTGDSLSWQQACDTEMNSLLKKDVWTLVDRPVNKCIIRGMWIFRKKLKGDGSCIFKARFVALGNRQVEGLDYGDTFAPTGKPTSLRLLVAMASIHGWDIHQMDAVTAFLNGILEEEIYIEQPEGYVIEGQEGKMLRLNRSLYGLKQSPKIWQDDVQEYLVSIGFVQCQIDHCTYIRTDNNLQKFTAVYVHVDDLAITGNNSLEFKAEISNKWEMEDLGLAQVVVGIEIN